MLFERAWLFVSGFLVGFWVIRYLGPRDFGEFSAALSITAVFGGLSLMGIETVILRRLAQPGADARTQLSTAAWLRALGCLLYVPLCASVAWLVLRSASDAIWMAILISASAIFRVPDVVGLHLQAENKYKQAALARLTVRVFGDAVRITLIVLHADVVWFAVALLAEAVFSGLLFASIGKSRGLLSATPNYGGLTSMFVAGRPILLSGLMAAAYARADQAILYFLLGPTQNGHYAAAGRVSEVFNIVIVSIGTVAASHFGRLASVQPTEFDQELKKYYRFILFCGFSLSLLISTFSVEITALLYGSGFSEGTSQILRIHAWTILLVWTSVGLEPWFYHYEKINLYVPKTLLTLLLTVPAIYFATYRFGATGTAFAVVLTYFFSVFLSNALLPGARDAFLFQLEALGLRKHKKYGIL